MKNKKGTLTLKKLGKLYKEAEEFHVGQDIGYPDWHYWFYKLMFWKYKEVMKGVFLKKI